MDKVSVQIGGNGYALNADGTVFDSSQANAGTWTDSNSTPAANALAVSIAGTVSIVSAQYGFNANNQLLVSLKNSDGSWAPQQALNGRLVVHGNQNIGYQLVDDQGNDLGGSLTVYGDLHLDANNDLTITLTGGGVAVINADQIGHDANNSTAAGDDVIIISATTYDYNGSLMLPADISLPGSFMPAGNNLVFEMNGQTGVNLEFTGTFKGTSVGIEYHQGNGASTLVFTASGSYRWDSGRAAFTVYLGNSANGYTANASFSTSTKLGSGQFRMNGQLDFSPSGGAGLNMDLNLNLQQKWDANNCITFDVVASDQNGQMSYDLGVEGTARLVNGALTFDMKFSSTGALTVDLGYTGQALTAAVNLTFNQNLTTVGAGVTLSVTVSWQNGTRVASPVQKTIAATSAHA